MDLKNNLPLPTYYTILPACIRLDVRLSQGAKLLWSDISVLALKKGYCFSTNDYFARIYGVKNRTVCDWIRGLRQNDFIVIKHIRTGIENRVIRHIYPNTKQPELADFFASQGKKMLAAYAKKQQSDNEKNCVDIITRKNNTRIINGISLTQSSNIDEVSDSEIDDCIF